MTETSEIDSGGTGRGADRSGTDADRPRSIGVAFVGVVAVIALIGGLLGGWTIRRATDSGWFADRIEEVMTDPEVAAALAERLVESVVVELEVEEQLAEVLPDEIESIAAVVLAGVRSFVTDQVADALQRPELAALVADIAERAHSVAISVLEGDDVVDGVRIVDGEVRVNLLPLVSRVLLTLQDVGLFADVDLPELDRGGDPDEQRAALSEAFDREIDEDFGEVVMLRSDAVDEVSTTVQLLQDVLLLAKRLVVVLIVVGLALAAVTIWLARRRLRAASWIVGGLLVGALVLNWATDRARQKAPDAVEGAGAKRTVEQVVGALEDSLNRTMFSAVLLGTLAVVVAAVIAARAPRTPDPST